MQICRSILKFFVRPPLWSQIRRVGGSAFSRVSLIIPIVGYLIIFNKTIFSSLALFDGISSSVAWYQLSYEKKLILLYVGGVVFALATFLYKAFCPQVIQQNEGEREYCSGEMTVMTRGRIDIILMEYKKLLISGRRLGSLPNCAQPYVELINSDVIDEPEDALGSDGTRLKNDGFISANKHAIQNILSGIYHLEDMSSWKTRSAINIAYKLSILLMTIPSLESTIRVLIYIFHGDGS